MEKQSLEPKPVLGLSLIGRLLGIGVSFGTLYFMIAWTFQLGQIDLKKLPIIESVNTDLKKKPLDPSGDKIPNQELAINSFAGKVEEPDEVFSPPILVPEIQLAEEDGTVSEELEATLAKSIAMALDRLVAEDARSRGEIYHLYVGSFDSKEDAKKQLELISKIGELSFLKGLTIVSGLFGGDAVSYRLQNVDPYTYELAKQLCDAIITHNLDCKVIMG